MSSTRRFCAALVGVMVVDHRAAFIATGLLLLVLTGVRWSVECTGGTVLQVRFATPPDATDVRDAVSSTHLAGAQLQKFGARNDYVIRVQSQSADAAAQPETIVEQRLRERFNSILTAAAKRTASTPSKAPTR